MICSLGDARAAAAAESKPVPAGQWATVEERLKQNKFEPSFIELMRETYEPDSFKDVVELNVNLFLRKVDHHAVQVTDEAVENVKAFSLENAPVFTKMEETRGVPGPIVASLLWIESRYGKVKGRFHVLSVFAHLVQADRPDVVEHLQGAGAKRFTTAKVNKKSLTKIRERATKKSKWAISELKKMQQMAKRDHEMTKSLRGSFAGAFGIPQFLPSAYLRWAKAERDSETPDLNRVGDAIHSVAFYLRENGWNTRRKKTHIRALMNYNASEDYANAILRLARRSGGDFTKTARRPARQENVVSAEPAAAPAP